MSNWNTIDLHMHTRQGVTRDGGTDDVNFSYQKFVEVMVKYDIKLMAVTNHNIVNLINYILMRYLANIIDNKILLGVELDSVMETDETPLHMVVILNDYFRSNFEFAKYINNETLLKSDKVVYNSKEVVTILRYFDALIIPHGDKSRGMLKDASFEQINEALKKIREGFIRIFDSPSNWKLEKIKQFLAELNESNLDEFGGVLFSDIRDWNNYELNFRHFKMNAEPTFKGLVHSTSNPTMRFSPADQIIENSNYIKKMVIKAKNDKNIIEENTIFLESGFNCIIGKSGSGKSLFIHLIKKVLFQEDLVSENYKFSDNTQVELYNEEGEKLIENNINASEGENLYNKIIKAYSSNDSEDIYSVIKLLNQTFEPKKKFTNTMETYLGKLKDYCLLREKINDNKEEITQLITTISSSIKECIKLSGVKTFPVQLVSSFEHTYDEDSLIEYKEYSTHIKGLYDVLERYKGKYKNKIKYKINDLNNLFKLGLDEMEYVIEYEIFENKKIDLINNSIRNINKKISKQSARKTALNGLISNTSQRLTKLVTKTYKSTKKKKAADIRLKLEDLYDSNKINDKYNIIVTEYVNKESINKCNEKDNDIFNTHGAKANLNGSVFYDLTDVLDSKMLINKYFEIGVISSRKVPIKSSFNVIVKIEFNGQDVSKLNPGDIAKTYINVYFEEEVNKKDNNVVLFDQIENDVDKDFISNTLRELIEKTKGNVQTIIVTHDPIIAVNADPNNYIEAIKSKNHISYRNFHAESSLEDELENIANNVDGSKMVIKQRYEIYEGERK